MENKTFKNTVKMVNKGLIAGGTGIVCGIALGRLNPRNMPKTLLLLESAAVAATVCKFQDKLGVYEEVDAFTDTVLDGMDSLIKRLGYDRSDYRL